MTLRDICLQPLAIPFRTAFQHAAAIRRHTAGVLVVARAADGACGIGEGCPREYVTGESITSAGVFFAAHAASIRRQIRDLQTLEQWTRENARLIDDNPAAWSALELALLDLFARQAGTSVEVALGLRPLAGVFQYSAVLGDADRDQFAAQLERYRAHGFEDYKLKLSGERHRDRWKLAAVYSSVGSAARVRVDANNLWQNAEHVISYMRTLDWPVFAIEEPLQAGDYAGMARVADALATRIIVDESLTRVSQLRYLADQPRRWIINLRVSKMGGLSRSLAIVDAARRLGLDLIVGAHVGETSILTRAGLTVAHAASDRLLAQEGAFGTLLLEREITAPSLMFQTRGILEPDRILGPGTRGLGLVLLDAPTGLSRQEAHA